MGLHSRYRVEILKGDKRLHRGSKGAKGYMGLHSFCRVDVQVRSLYRVNVQVQPCYCVDILVQSLYRVDILVQVQSRYRVKITKGYK